MNKARAAGLKKTLLEYREKTVANIKQKIINLKETSNSTERRLESSKSDFGDYYDVQEVDTDLDLSLIQIENNKLARINEALKRLESGRYGYCSDCDGEISEARLNALPFAIRCRGCEELRESMVKSA